MLTLCTRCAVCLLPVRYSRGWVGRLTGGQGRGEWMQERWTDRLRSRREETKNMLQPIMSRRAEKDCKMKIRGWCLRVGSVVTFSFECGRERKIAEDTHQRESSRDRWECDLW